MRILIPVVFLAMCVGSIIDSTPHFPPSHARTR